MSIRNQPSIEHTRPTSVSHDSGDATRPTPSTRPTRRKLRRRGALIWGILLGGLLSLYLLFPVRTNLLLLGIDRSPEGTLAGRSDTMILLSMNPLYPEIHLLSIPRDLWVEIPQIGQNRINTAHFFGEVAVPGSGGRAAIAAIEHNFDVRVTHYLRFDFGTFVQAVDALGGITLHLESPTGGWPAGSHLLNGEQTLAFVRDRQGTDDFARLVQGQLVIRSFIDELKDPRNWPSSPRALVILFQGVEGNLPVWQWPRMAFAFLRSGADGMETHRIDRSMVQPFTTEGGAAVLLPNWGAIQPLLRQAFGSSYDGP